MLDDLTNFEKIEDKVIPVLKPYDENYLLSHPGRIWNGLMECYYILVKVGAVPVTSVLMEKWGISAGYLEFIAISNLQNCKKIVNMAEELAAFREELNPTNEAYDNYMNNKVILTNVYTFYGASMILSKSILTEVCEKMEAEAIYIVMLDSHHCICSDVKLTTYEAEEYALINTNLEDEEGEALTNKVFYFNPDQMGGAIPIDKDFKRQ